MSENGFLNISKLKQMSMVMCFTLAALFVHVALGFSNETVPSGISNSFILNDSKITATAWYL